MLSLKSEATKMLDILNILYAALNIYNLDFSPLKISLKMTDIQNFGYSQICCFLPTKLNQWVKFLKNLPIDYCY